MSSPTASGPATSPEPIRITVYRWAGKWGPFKIKIPCGECAVTVDIAKDTIEKELAGVPVELDVREWLSEWWKPLRLGAWHAPITVVEKEVVAEGEALNRGVLAEKVMAEATKRFAVTGTRLFGKDNCPHCERAKTYLKDAGIAFTYHDVVANPGAMYEMFARVKPIVGPKTPITTPQVWIDGSYIGGADQVARHLGIAEEKKPRKRRGFLGLPFRAGRRAAA